MIHVYKCGFCDSFFADKAEAQLHEERCGYNPQNKINDRLVFRLSMVYESLSKIIACALHEVAKEDLDWLYSEVERATSTNCPYTIKKHRERMMSVILASKDVGRKHQGRNSSTYKDVNREYPELLKAVIDTLNRKAWNERSL